MHDVLVLLAAEDLADRRVVVEERFERLVYRLPGLPLRRTCGYVEEGLLVRLVLLVDATERGRLHEQLILGKLQAVYLRHRLKAEITEGVEGHVLPQFVPALAAAI